MTNKNQQHDTPFVDHFAFKKCHQQLLFGQFILCYSIVFITPFEPSVTDNTIYLFLNKANLLPLQGVRKGIHSNYGLLWTLYLDYQFTSRDKSELYVAAKGSYCSSA